MSFTNYQISGLRRVVDDLHKEWGIHPLHLFNPSIRIVHELGMPMARALGCYTGSPARLQRKLAVDVPILC